MLCGNDHNWLMKYDVVQTGVCFTQFQRKTVYSLMTIMSGRSKQTMIDTFKKLKIISLQFGLIVNENKTKYMERIPTR